MLYKNLKQAYDIIRSNAHVNKLRVALEGNGGKAEMERDVCETYTRRMLPSVLFNFGKNYLKTLFGKIKPSATISFCNP